MCNLFGSNPVPRIISIVVCCIILKLLYKNICSFFYRDVWNYKAAINKSRIPCFYFHKMEALGQAPNSIFRLKLKKRPKKQICARFRSKYMVSTSARAYMLTKILITRQCSETSCNFWSYICSVGCQTILNDNCKPRITIVGIIKIKCALIMDTNQNRFQLYMMRI